MKKTKYTKKRYTKYTKKRYTKNNKKTRINKIKRKIGGANNNTVNYIKKISYNNSNKKIYVEFTDDFDDEAEKYDNYQISIEDIIINLEAQHSTMTAFGTIPASVFNILCSKITTLKLLKLTMKVNLLKNKSIIDSISISKEKSALPGLDLIRDCKRLSDPRAAAEAAAAAARERARPVAEAAAAAARERADAAAARERARPVAEAAAAAARERADAVAARERARPVAEAAAAAARERAEAAAAAAAAAAEVANVNVEIIDRAGDFLKKVKKHNDYCSKLNIEYERKHDELNTIMVYLREILTEMPEIKASNRIIYEIINSLKFLSFGEEGEKLNLNTMRIQQDEWTAQAAANSKKILSSLREYKSKKKGNNRSRKPRTRPPPVPPTRPTRHARPAPFSPPARPLPVPPVPPTRPTRHARPAPFSPRTRPPPVPPTRPTRHARPAPFSPPARPPHVPPTRPKRHARPAPFSPPARPRQAPAPIGTPVPSPIIALAPLPPTTQGNIPYVYNDTNLYQTIYAPDYITLCSEKVAGNTNNKARQNIMCLINFFEILYSNIAKLYYYENNKVPVVINFSQNVHDYFMNTDILNHNINHLEKYNEILSNLKERDIKLIHKPYLDSIIRESTELRNKFSKGLTQEKLDKKIIELEKKNTEIKTKIFKQKKMLENIKKIISNYAEYKNNLGWKQFDGAFQTSFKLYMNDLTF